ncbi:branched-chain amino acid ABC transporter permease [Pseudorhodoplanes sp.]|uniref:branched-chain amino acid ABC transporter permease n=1 Tax=Pseudorhodoplanes sp. TaxID=1934341 RepID=UPI003D0E74CB
MTIFPERIAPGAPRTIVAAAVLLSLALLPAVAQAYGEPFYITLVARILIFALAASGLNLLLGYAGLVSFGHALYVGLGAYVVGILAASGFDNGWIQLAVTIILCAIVGALTGAISLRTSGMAFIMITLAFAQMFYFLGVSLKQYGGDDGLQILERSDLWPLSIKTNTGLYYLAYVLLLVTLYLSWRLVHARFGRVLRASKSNAPRMRVLGFPVFRYQLAAYVLSGCICGVAGFLLGNLTNFTSPAYMFWTVSGDLIVMVMLGGIATILGPLLGSAVFVLLETVLAGYTQHWMLFLGPVIVLIALVAKRGLYGLLPR